MPNAAITTSIIIPVGDVDDLLPQQLTALSQQTGLADYEIVLSRNTSDFAAARRLTTLMGRYPDLPLRAVDSSDIRSASHARNVGARLANGEKLLFCDGDDIADPGWARALIDALDTERAVGGHLDETMLAIPGQEDWRPPATPGELPSFLGHPYLVSANMGCYRDDFEKVGGFDESLIRGEDMAFSFALIEEGITLGYVPDAVMHYRHRKGMMPMLRQHYFYGRGMSQLIMRGGLPDADDETGVVGAAFRPNGQAVPQWSLPHILRKGAIATGRVVGLIEERLS